MALDHILYSGNISLLTLKRKVLLYQGWFECRDILYLEFSWLDKVRITLQNTFEFVKPSDQKKKIIQKVVLVTLLVTLAHAKCAIASWK